MHSSPRPPSTLDRIPEAPTLYLFRMTLIPFPMHSQPALSPSLNGPGWVQPPRSSHKGTRREFERDLDHQDPLQTPSKRHKSSSVHSNPFAPPQPQPPSPPPPPPPQHHQSVCICHQTRTRIISQFKAAKTGISAQCWPIPRAIAVAVLCCILM